MSFYIIGYCKIILTFLHMCTVIALLKSTMINLENIGLRNTRNLGVIGKVFTMSGFVGCARQCEKINICRGFNYMRSELLCEVLVSLDDQTHDINGWRFVKMSSILEDKTILTQTRGKKCVTYGSNIQLSNGSFVCLNRVLPIDCGDSAFMQPEAHSGVYRIKPKKGENGLKVFCDMTSDGSGWTVIQKRTDQSVNFSRYWRAYKGGFGDLNGEHWLGNDNLYTLTSAYSYKLRIEMTKTSGESLEATYSHFSVADANDEYRLTINGFSGNTTNSFMSSNGMRFSTKDEDNDNYKDSCSKNSGGGGWWFASCGSSSLNEIKSTSCSACVSIFWHSGLHELKSMTMKIKRNE